MSFDIHKPKRVIEVQRILPDLLRLPPPRSTAENPALRAIENEALSGYTEMTLRYWPHVHKDAPWICLFWRVGTTDSFYGQGTTAEEAMEVALRARHKGLENHPLKYHQGYAANKQNKTIYVERIV